MAKFGANYPCFKGKEKEKGVIIGKLVSANLTVNMASGELYADDALAEQISEFSSGTIAMETDDMDAAVAAEIYGCTVSEDNTVTYKAGDNAPTGSLGYYKVLMRKGVKAYEGYLRRWETTTHRRKAAPLRFKPPAPPLLCLQMTTRIGG